MSCFEPRVPRLSRPALVVASFGDTASLERAPEEVTQENAVGHGTWDAIVWNDPVNLMNYVAYIFRSYFGYGEEQATHLMLRVHYEGRAVVAQGTRERIEVDVRAMHGFGLQATMQPSED